MNPLTCSYHYSAKADPGHKNDTARESKVGENDMQAQEATIHRVPPWEWREVKRERAINTELPALIGSSKGHGRVGRRATGQGSARHNGTLDSGNSHLGGDPSFGIAYRLAINSRILLNLLRDITGMDFPEDRNVWLRPFKCLVAYETEIRQALQEAELPLDQVEEGSGLSDQTDTLQNHDGVSVPATILVQGGGEVRAGAAKPAPHAMDESSAKAERDQLRCLMDFMNTDMQDIFDVKRQVAGETLKEIAFEHLWLLYRPGDLVYSSKAPEESSTYQAYRVLHVTGGRPILDTTNKSNFHAVYDRNWEEESESEDKACDVIKGSPSNMTPFIIDCFSIDFDGNRLGPKSRRFVIPKYSCKRKVDAFEICPSFLNPQHEKVYQAMVERGRRFTQLANGSHKRYSGTTLRESRELWQARATHMGWVNYIIHDEEVLDPSRAPPLSSICHTLLI